MNLHGKYPHVTRGFISFRKFPTLLLILSSTLIQSCTKDSTNSDELIGNWVRSSEFEGVGRTEAITFTIGEDVYVGGGYDGSERLNDFWKFDQQTTSWSTIAPFPGTARSSAVAFSINGKGYIGTGYDDNDNKLKDFWEYDPATNTWTRLADFGGSARYNAVGFSIGSKGYIATGYDGNYLKDLWEYDPASNSWTQKASLGGSKRSEAVAFVYNNLGYVLTGFNNGSYVNDFWAYDPATNKWTEKRKINDYSSDAYDDDYDDYIRRSNAMIFLLDSKAYLVCGNRSSTIGTAWEYDITTDFWKEKTGFEGTAREGGLGFSVNNKGYITTGNNSSYRFDDMWEFYPEADQEDSDN